MPKKPKKKLTINGAVFILKGMRATLKLRLPEVCSREPLLSRLLVQAVNAIDDLIVELEHRL